MSTGLEPTVLVWDDGGAPASAALDGTLADLRAQTIPARAIVVVEAGTGARPPGPRRPPWIRTLRGAGEGRAALLGRGLATTEGALVCALEAGDRLPPTFLERSLERLEDSGPLALVGALPGGPAEGSLLARLLAAPAAPVWLARVEPLRALGAWDASLPPGEQDLDLWLRLLAGGHRAELLGAPGLERPGRRAAASEALVARHRAAFRAALPELLTLEELADAPLRRELALLERERAERAAAIGRARDELGRLAAAGAGAAAPPATPSVSPDPEAPEALRRRVAELERAHGAALAEVAALRASWSWRVTAPLRAIWERLGLAGRR